MSRRSGEPTSTGGREATTRHIPPKLALSVGMPSSPAPPSWKWSALTTLARLESGHTPSRRHPEYWGGDIPWIGIADAKINHTRSIFDTAEKTNALGIENSSARVLPKGTVCLSRTASVGYVVIMGRPMATSQDFVNWICGDHLDPAFLKYLFIAEGEDLLRFASGAVHQTIYFPEAKAFHVCHPPLPEQRRIVSILDEAFAGLGAMRANAEKNLQNARELFEGYLDAIFSDEGRWPEMSFDEICAIESKLVDPREPSYLDLPHLGAGNMVSHTGELTDVKTAREEGLISGKFLFDRRMILYSKIRPYLMKVCRPEFDGLCSADVYPLLPKPGTTDRNFLFYLLMTRRFTDYAIQGSARAGMPKVNREHLFAYRCKVPDLKEQRIWVKALDSAQADCSRLESIYTQKLAAIDELKQSILQKAFAGELTAAAAVAA